MSKLWDGRLSETAGIVDEFTSSLEVDKNLYFYDIIGTLAHVISLNKTGIITDGELNTVSKGLNDLKKKLDKSNLQNFKHEDIHSLIENELKDLIGELSGKIHTGRSRNDQVVLDEKLYVKDSILKLLDILWLLLEKITLISIKNIDLIMPAYTHMQKAQPVLVSHYLMSFYEKFYRDFKKLLFNFEESDVLPLGSAACTGSGYDIDRDFLKEILNFKSLSKNSMDEISSRDFLVDFIYSMTNIMLHLSRFSEDLIIFNTSEFSFIEISDSFCTGSSIMPQKKNPDVLELIRAKSAMTIGNLNQILIIFKGLPSAYNRDMQEDKSILFDCFKQTSASLAVFKNLIENIKFNEASLLNSYSNGFMQATDLADYLVKKGCTFRNSHNIVGRLVRYCIKNKINISNLEISKLKEFSDKFDIDLYDKISIDACISSKNIFGGTSKIRVKDQISDARKDLKRLKNKIASLKSRIADYDYLIKLVDK